MNLCPSTHVLGYICAALRASSQLFLSKRSQQLSKLLNCQAGIAQNSAHYEGVDRILAWNRQDSLTVRHHDMLALTQNTKSGLLQGANRP